MRVLLLSLLAGSALLLAGPANAGPDIDGIDLVRDVETNTNELIEKLWKERLSLTLSNGEIDERRNRAFQDYGRYRIDCLCKKGSALQVDLSTFRPMPIKCEEARDVNVKSLTLEVKVARCEIAR